MTELGKVRVLHVITRMVKGGAQENTLATTAGLNGPGWSSSLAMGPAAGPEGSLEPECVAVGVRMLRVPELVRELSPGRDLVALQRLTALMRKERPHIVHTHTSKAGILGRIAARRARIPVVVHTPHGHVFHSYEGRVKTRLFVQLERACAGMADRLVALTERELREHVEAGVGRRERWVTVHSGVDFSLFEACRGVRDEVRAEMGLSPEAQVLGTVGRLVPVKGQRYLIEAFARLAAARPHLHLHLLLVGDGPLYGELVALGRSLGLRLLLHPEDSTGLPLQNPKSKIQNCGTVHMLGLRRDVPQLLSAMDVFVLPSLNEGMGRVLVEAMAMELPCVASRVSGIPDVVADGVTGLLVSPRDAGALAAALFHLLEHPGQAREMGRLGRLRVVPEFSVERMIEKLEAVYRELLMEKGIPAPLAMRSVVSRQRSATALEASAES